MTAFLLTADDIAALVALDEDALQDRFCWIDWRSHESEVVDGFSEYMTAEDALTCVDGEDARTIAWRGETFAIPLTGTGSDRYVMIHSVAEIVKDRYTVWGDPESIAGSDTHAFLILPNAVSDALVAQHPAWVAQHLRRLDPGMDEFNGIRVPWFGHETHNPDFERDRAALQDQQAAVERMLTDAFDAGAKKKPFWKFW
jgi:hypothetical protein